MSKKRIKKTVNNTFNFKKPSIFRIVVSYITAYSMMFMNVVPAFATEITGITGNNGVYDIAADKISGDTGFRNYEKFELSENDVANLQFKKDAQEYGKFVNLVDNKVDINGIVNTVRGDAFYNGHAIFVSPKGIVVGASGVLNVGSLTMMAPSENAYNAFKNNYGANLKDYEYNVEHENYKSLIRNSSGTIEINGKIFAKENVNAYGRQIKVQKNASNQGDAAIFAGVQNQNVITQAADADALFNSLVDKNITNATGFNLQNGKISLVTNKANDEVVTTVKTSEENNKKYKTTTEINTGLLLKKETKEEIKTGDEQDENKEVKYSIDKTFEKSSLSADPSSITVKDAKIAANDVSIQANAESVKTINDDLIKNYATAAKAAEDAGDAADKDKADKDKDKKDETTGYIIPKEFRDVAPEASATVTISSSKIHGDKVAIKANAVNKTETYIQLLDPVWEKWISALGMDILLRILNKVSDDQIIPAGVDIPWSSVEMVKSYFSDDAYTGFDGAKAEASVTVSGSEIVAKKSVDIEADSEAATNISTAKLDSHPLFFYGLGVKAKSEVNVSANTTLKTTGEEGAVNLTAFAQTEDNIKYDSSNFLAISDKPSSNNDTNNNTNNDTNNNTNNDTNNNTNNDTNNNTNNDTNNNTNNDTNNNTNNDTNNNDSNNNSNNNNNGQQSTVSAYNLTLLNNSIFSDADVKVDGSTVETNDFTAKAIDFNKSEIEMKNISNVGENSDKTGIAAAIIFNHTRTNSNVEISNDTNINAANDAKLLAQNINYLQNSVESEVKAKSQTYDIQTKELPTYAPTYTIKAYEWLNSKFLDKVTNKIGDILDKLQLQISGSAIWNDEQNTSTSSVSHATVEAGNVDVVSNMADLALNSAEATAGADKKFSAGAAIIVNDQSNTNNAKIVDNSTITAANGVNVSATTQLPMNPMQLKIGQKLGDSEDESKNLELFVGAKFDGGDSVNSWDASFIHTKLTDILNWDNAKKIWNGIKSPRNFLGSNKISLDGLFNNLVKSEANGEYVGVAGSVLANSVANTTNAYIENSKVKAEDGNVDVNASNSVINYNGAGKVDFLIDGVNELIAKIKAKADRTPEEEETIAKFGIGGSVLVDKYTNNANAYIKNSEVSATNKNPTDDNADEKGNINVNAASEEGYINLAVTGGKADLLAIVGSVNVQRIDGKTKAYITDSQKIEADNVNVNAGKASIAPKKSGEEDPVELDDDSGELSANDARDVKDTVTNISMIGVNAQQTGSGASVGASVDVTKISKEIEAAVSNSTITASQDVAVVADTSSKKIDVLLAGAFAGGVSADRETQETANNDESGTTGENQPQRMQNAGNWMDEVDNARDDEEDVMNLRNLFNEDENNAATQGARGLNGEDTQENNSTNSQTNNNNDSNNSNNSNNNSNNSNNPTSLTGSERGADPATAQSNLSIALAGAVDVTNDYTKTTAKVENSTLNAGKEVKVTANNDILAVQVNGALAKSSTVSAGAGVNIYNNKSETEALVDNSTINFNTEDATGLTVTAGADIDLIDVTAGIGVAAGQNSSVAASVGGSFGFNKLQNVLTAQLNNTTVKKENDDVPDADVKVEAKDDSLIWNITGAAGFGKSTGVNIGAGAAATLNYGKKSITAAIIGSTLSNVKDVKVNADLQQNYNTIAVAGALSFGASSSFTLDGAANIELNSNNVTARAANSAISASGDVDITANADIKNQSLAGAVDFSTASAGFGVGIGAIVNVNKSEIKAETDGLTLTKSKSLDIQANETEDLKFLAANLGIQTSGGATININGIANVFLSNVIAQAINNSVLNSDGNINITSGYDNKLQGITATAEFAKGLVIGPNLIGNVYNNTVKADLQNGSEIQKAKDVAVNATSVELINLFPVSAGVSTNITAVSANLNANIVKNTVEALLGGKITQSTAVLVNAADDTTIYTRGGAVAAGSATVVIGGSVNVDVISKTVQAYVNGANVTSGDVKVFASSVNSMGGTKNDDQHYATDDVTTDAYRNKMLKKDEDGNYVGLKEGSSFANWNMFYDLSGGATAAIAGAVIVKSIHNTVQAEIANSTITAEKLDVAANEYSIKNIMAGTLEGAGTLAVGVNVLVMRDKSVTKALIGQNSKLAINNTVNINAANTKDNQQIVIAGGGAGTVAANTNTVVNKIEDEAIAQIDNQNGANEISAGTLNISATENMNASHILVSASGAGTVALSVAPIVNTYNGTTDASIKNATVKDAAINLYAQNNISTFDVDAGVAGAGTVAGTAVAIKNNYTGTTKAYMDNAVINTPRAIAIAADSVIKSENWIGALSVVGVGVSLLVNLVLNNVISETEAGIMNSTIQNAGNITINTNNGKKDEMKNRALSIAFGGEGAGLVAGVVQNIYNNTVKSYADNNAVNKALSMTLNANSDHELDNKTIGASGVAIGASLLANALVNQIDSSTSAIVNARSKTMNIDNALRLNAKDNTVATNSMGMVTAAGLGAAAGGNINLYYANNLANTAILSNSDGQINAGSVSSLAEMINGLDNLTIGVAVGAGAIAADVAVIKLGKRTPDDSGEDYSDAQKKAKIKDAVDYTKSVYDKSTADDAENVKNLYTPTSLPSNIKTGAVAEVNGNLKTTNDIEIEAKSKIKGLKEGSDTLELVNTNVSGGGIAINVGVKNIQLVSNTLAEISGGKVESTNGDVTVNAESKADVKLKNVEVAASAVAVSGSGAIYNNTSDTVAQVKNATIRAKDLNIVSKSDNKSVIDSTSVIVSGANAVVDIAENTDNNKSKALISGNVDIDTSGKLTLHSTTNTNLDSSKAIVKVAIASLVGVSKNENEVKTTNRALIENATGSIKTNGLEITTDYGKMYTHSMSNITTVQLADIVNIKSVGAHMTADFKSGIDSLDGLTISNSGSTVINTAKDITSNKEGIVAKSEIHNVSVSLLNCYGGTASKADNRAVASTVLKVKEHTANGLEINADLKSTAKAEGGATSVTLAGVSDFNMFAKDDSTLRIDIAGENNIIGSGINEATIKAKHYSEVNTNASAFSAGIINGHKMKLTSELTSNTIGNIGGTLNADKVTVDLNTERVSILSKSSSSGGAIDAGNSSAKNTLTGSSILTVSASSDKDKAVNAMDIKNKSNNVFDMVSSDGHGGLLSISEGSTSTTFSTATTTNINNTNINSAGDVKYEVANNAVIKDTATSYGGGLIAVYGNSHTGNFTAAANLNLNNAKINAKNIELSSKSDMRTHDNGYISYTGAAGGFVAGSTLELRNTLTQTNTVDIAGASNLNASSNVKISALTSSRFKQKVDSTAGAFVAVPRARSYLTVDSTNNVNVAAGAKVKAGDELEINFDSDNELASRTNAEAHHFGFKDPVAESYLTLNINNNLDNSGSLEAGNLVDINYMQNSINNLTQYAYSEAHAAVATTTEDGRLTKKLNNALNINSGADITSGKSIDVNYSSGRGYSSSYVGWRTVSYALFGIPISNSDHKSVTSISHSPSLTIADNGKMVVGQNNSRYMKINRDGSVDLDSLVGFYDDDYKLYDDQIVSGEGVRQRSLEAIQIEINNIDENLQEVAAENTILSDYITKIEQERQKTQEKLDEINGFIDDEKYELVDDESGAFNKLIADDLESMIIGEGEGKLTREQYEAIATAYNAKLNEMYDQASGVELMTISAFLNDLDSSVLDLSDAQKQTILAAYRLAESDGIKDMIVKTAADEPERLTEEQYNTLITEYKNKVLEIAATEAQKTSLTAFLDNNTVMLNDAPIVLTDAQRATITAAQNKINSSLSLSAKGEFIIYKRNDNEYFVDVSIVTQDVGGTEVTTYEEVEQYKKELADMDELLSAFNEKLTANTEINNNLTARKAVLRNEYTNTENERYDDREETYAIVFYDLYSNGGSVNIAGANNLSIGGDGNIIVAQPGLKIDNYSNRSLIFNDIDFNSGGVGNGLTINGKNHAVFINTQKAVSGWYPFDYLYGGANFSSIPDTSTGVHYLSGIQGIEPGISIHTYYDANHPFIPDDTPDSYAVTIFMGDILNAGNPFTVTNDSSLIAFVGSVVDSGQTLWASPYQVIADLSKSLDDDVPDRSGTRLNLGSGSYLFGGEGIELEAETINITGDVVSGYKNRGITITDEMLQAENLIVDPNTGETNMLNLGGNTDTSYLNDGVNYGNIKALYKDGEIHLFNVAPNYFGRGIRIVAGENTSSKVIGNIIVHDNHTTINVDNQTTNNVPLNVYDIHNTTANIAIEKTLTNVDGTITEDNDTDAAVTNITSTGNVKLHRQVINNTVYDYTNGFSPEENKHTGSLNILVKNGTLSIDEFNNSSEVAGDAIINTGDINITLQNNASAVINGKISNTDGGIFIGDVNNGAGDIILNASVRNKKNVATDGGNVVINTRGKATVNNDISNKKGNINIKARGMDIAGDEAQILAEEGNISFTNDAYEANSDKVADMVLNRTINAANGSISITNNGDSATIGGTLVDEQGDIVIVNTNGDMTISANISHDAVNNSANGMISITNSGGKLNLNTPIATYGAGKSVNDVLTAIVIDNQSTTDGLTLNIPVTAKIGDIIIRNAAQDLVISGAISNALQGNIGIYNAGKDLQITSDITNYKGNTTITNTGNGKALLEGNITDHEGNISVANSNAGALKITGNLVDNKGNISIVNDSADGAEIGVADDNGRSVITGKQGDIAITNNNGTLKLVSEIRHNQGSSDAESIISITNGANAGAVEINAPIATYGAGKTVDNNTTAIIIDNQSSTAGMTLAQSISARVGDIIIKNAGGKLTSNATISGTEAGGISITNNGADGAEIAANIAVASGDVEVVNNAGDALINGEIVNHDGNTSIANSGGVLTYSGAVTNDEGNVVISNKAGAKQAQIGGTITNKKGNTTIENAGKSLVFSGTIDNRDGSVSISGTNTADTASVTVSGQITNAGGDVVIGNLGAGTEISGEVANTNGSINVSNAKGNLHITESATIENTTADANKGINITNAATADVLRIEGDIDSVNKGNINIVNNGGGNTVITGDITANDGNIDITNNTAGNLKIEDSSVVTETGGNINIHNTGGKLSLVDAYVETETAGDISVVNEGTDGTAISGDIITADGDISVANKAKKLEIEADISADNGDITIDNTGKALSITEDATLTTETAGNINITNKGDGNLTVAGDITTETVGDINISNQQKDVEISGDITAEDGDILITNSGEAVAITGDIETTEGDISVANQGSKGTTIAGDITTADGDISVTNKERVLNISGDVATEAGDIDIVNNSADSGTTITGDISDDNGDISIENNGGKLALSGDIDNYKGNIDIDNNGADGTEISGDVYAKEGDIAVANTAGVLALTANGTVTDDKGNINITNTATDKGTNLIGNVLNKEGNITIANSGDSLDVSGQITDKNGKINITNSGAGGTQFAATAEVINDKSDTGITNNSGNLNIADGAKIRNTESGNINIENKDGVFAIAGTVAHDGTGNVTLNNSGNGSFETTTTAQIAATSGDISITNTGANGAEIAGNISNTGGNTVIDNKNGLEYSATLDNDGGNTTITNTGDATMSGSIDNSGGNTTINNNGGALALASTVNNNGGNLSVENTGNGTTVSGDLNNTGGNVVMTNAGGDLILTDTATVDNGAGDIIVTNSGNGKFSTEATVNNAESGNITVTNTGANGAEIGGTINNTNGNTIVSNQNGNMLIATAGQITDTAGNIELNNTGADGLNVEGNVLAQNGNIIVNNSNSDLTIGEFASDNDNYIKTVSGDVVINQTGGNIVNGVVDPQNGTHQNADFGNPQHSYKTLLVADGDLTMNVTDGDIGTTANTNPGFSIDASTRDWTDSINVNVSGDVTATAANDNNDDARLINLRAKDSDLRIKNVTADGNVILTAADWQQADARPTPDDEAYFNGYSVINAADGDNAAVTGQNISVIASDGIGSSDKKLVYVQDTASNPQATVSLEAENGLYIVGDTVSDAGLNIYQMISKHGSIGLDLNKNTVINNITANKGVEITQKAQNLTIYELGMPSSGASATFDDMLYAHDDLVYGENPDDPSKSVVPQYVILRALDAMDSPERSDSNLKVYSLTVRGNNGENADYYPDGGRLADVTLMADNIYANSDKAPNSSVATKDYPDGYTQTGTSYTAPQAGLGDAAAQPAKGINTYGEGTAISLDVLGVDKDVVNEYVADAKRDEYVEQDPVTGVSSKFHNDEDSISDYDFRAKNAVISVNDYADTERGVEFDTLYADNAYINTLDTNLKVHDGYINNYAEIRNGDREAGTNRFTAVVDNDYRRLVPSNVQLYTQKTGSFGLTMNDKVKLHTPAPVVNYDWDKLVNTFSDENSFVRLGLKETELRQKAKDYYTYENVYVMPQKAQSSHEVWQDSGLFSNVKVMEISRLGAVIVNRDNWLPGEEHELQLSFDDVDITLKCVVTEVKHNLATIRFTDMPESVANKLTYRYMRVAANM